MSAESSAAGQGTEFAVGVDLGATELKAAAVTREGTTLEQRARATPQDDAAAWLAAVRDVTAELESALGHPARALGVAAPGLAAADQRSIASMPGRMRGLEGLDWALELGASRVPVLNDAHAALLAEAWTGAAKGHEHVALLTLGTGVGGAFLHRGELWRGSRGRAGHVGHMTVDLDGEPGIAGTPGSLEDAVGECTLARRSAGKWTRTVDLVAAVAAGDEAAAAVWSRSVRALACGIVSIVNAFDPGLVVIGGGIARAGDALFDPLRAQLAEIEWRPDGTAVEVVPAELDEMAGAVGAARLAFDSLPA